MKYLLENYKIDVNLKDKNGNTTFHYAAKKGSFDSLKYLFENYKNIVDINEKNDKGETALSMAKEKEHKEIIEYLMENGATNIASS